MARTAVWRVSLALEDLAAVEVEMCAFLASEGVQGRAVYVIQLVAEEIVRNLIEHTPPYASEEEATIELAVAPDVVTIVIEDTRPAFAPADAPQLDVLAPLDQRRPRGMGLHLVRSLTDDLRYERWGERNRLTAAVSRG